MTHNEMPKDTVEEQPRSVAELDKGVRHIQCPHCQKDRLTLLDDYGSDWLYVCDTCGEHTYSSELKKTESNWLTELVAEYPSSADPRFMEAVLKYEKESRTTAYNKGVEVERERIKEIIHKQKTASLSAYYIDKQILLNEITPLPEASL